MSVAELEAVRADYVDNSKDRADTTLDTIHALMVADMKPENVTIEVANTSVASIFLQAAYRLIDLPASAITPALQTQASSAEQQPDKHKAFYDIISSLRVDRNVRQQLFDELMNAGHTKQVLDWFKPVVTDSKPSFLIWFVNYRAFVVDMGNPPPSTHWSLLVFYKKGGPNQKVAAVYDMNSISSLWWTVDLLRVFFGSLKDYDPQFDAYDSTLATHTFAVPQVQKMADATDARACGPLTLAYAWNTYSTWENSNTPDDFKTAMEAFLRYHVPLDVARDPATSVLTRNELREAIDQYVAALLRDAIGSAATPSQPAAASPPSPVPASVAPVPAVSPPMPVPTPSVSPPPAPVVPAPPAPATPVPAAPVPIVVSLPPVAPVPPPALVPAVTVPPPIDVYRAEEEARAARLWPQDEDVAWRLDPKRTRHEEWRTLTTNTAAARDDRAVQRRARDEFLAYTEAKRAASLRERMAWY